MREINTEIEIDAPAEVVWQVLTDFDAYPAWNPFVREAEGEVREGARLRVRLQPAGGKPMTFRPVVTHVAPPHTFRWKGRSLIPGLFDGEHIFEIEPLGPDRVRLVHREEFSGLLVPVLWKSLNLPTWKGFEAMNAVLKRRAEAIHQGKEV